MIDRDRLIVWHRFGPEGIIEPGRYGGSHVGAAVRNDARAALEAAMNPKEPGA